LLIEFLLNVSEKDPAMTRAIPLALIAVAACSLEDPQPKLNPPTKMSP
jgi:hypothetical protein